MGLAKWSRKKLGSRHFFYRAACRAFPGGCQELFVKNAGHEFFFVFRLVVAKLFLLTVSLPRFEGNTCGLQF
jgi:hypothetical protein